MRHPKAYLKKPPRETEDLDSNEIILKLTGLLNRRRRLVDFPVDIPTAYWELFPPTMRSVLAVALPPKPGASLKEQGAYVRARNLRNALEEDLIIPIEFAKSRAFYFRFDSPLFVVKEPANAVLTVPPDFKFLGQVGEWLTAAESLDARHSQLLSRVGEFLRSAKYVTTLRQVWPELATVLKMTGPFRPISPTAASHLDHILPRKQRGYIEEQLAAAMMLDPYEPRAWTGYGPMGGE